MSLHKHAMLAVALLVVVAVLLLVLPELLDKPIVRRQPSSVIHWITVPPRPPAAPPRNTLPTMSP